MILCLEAERPPWPLAWASKKQTATSRSTTEAEMIALCARIFGDALPTQEFLEMLTGKETRIICHQDNSAVIAIVHSGYTSKLRHVSKTHRINLSSLYEVFEFDPYNRLQYITRVAESKRLYEGASSSKVSANIETSPYGEMRAREPTVCLR